MPRTANISILLFVNWKVLSNVELLQLSVLFALLAGPDSIASHIEGLTLRDALVFCFIVFVALLAWITHRTSGSRQAA